jgi:transposase
MAGSARHLTIGELEERFRGAKDVVERSHRQAIWLLAKGHSTAEVAELVALSPRWVSALRRRYAAEGADALGDRRRRNAGARPLMSAADLEVLRERLKTPPDEGGVRTGPKVARWIAVCGQARNKGYDSHSVQSAGLLAGMVVSVIRLGEDHITCFRVASCSSCCPAGLSWRIGRSGTANWSSRQGPVHAGMLARTAARQRPRSTAGTSETCTIFRRMAGASSSA